jgi:hypothetical protein
VARTAKADQLRDIDDGQVGSRQQLARALEAHVREVLVRSHPGGVFEYSMKVKRADMYGRGERREIDGVVMVLIQKAACIAYGLAAMWRERPCGETSMGGAAELEQQLED